MASTHTALMVPATVQLPYKLLRANTMPKLVMDIGRRATMPEIAKAGAPGRENMRAYGEAMVIPFMRICGMGMVRMPTGVD